VALFLKSWLIPYILYDNNNNNTLKTSTTTKWHWWQSECKPPVGLHRWLLSRSYVCQTWTVTAPDTHHPSPASAPDNTTHTHDTHLSHPRHTSVTTHTPVTFTTCISTRQHYIHTGHTHDTHLSHSWAASAPDNTKYTLVTPMTHTCHTHELHQHQTTLHAHWSHPWHTPVTLMSCISTRQH